MKTFAVLFFLLSILNLPLYWLFLTSTFNSDFNVYEYDFKKLESDSILLRISTFGNVGRSIYVCNTTAISQDLANKIYHERENNHHEEGQI